MEEIPAHRDQVRCYANLKTTNVEGMRTVSSQYVKDEHGKLLDPDIIHTRWLRFFRTLVNARSDAVR